MEAAATDLIRQWMSEPAALLSQQMMAAAVLKFHTFTLVLLRVSGLMTIGPVFGQQLVPGRIRILLVLTIALLITPTITSQSQARSGFHRLDVNGDRQLTADELPAHLQTKFAALLADPARPHVSPEEFRFHAQLPGSVAEYGRMAITEFSLGLVLGLGIHILLSGMLLAGEMIDQQTGISLGQVSNPAMEVNSSITGQFLFLLSTVVMLVMEPPGGLPMMMATLIETFQTIPVGEAFVSQSAIEYLSNLVHVSLLLGLQVAAPVLAMMSLVALTMGFLGHTVPQINILVIGFPVRAILNLFVLGVTLSGASRLVVDQVPEVLNELAARMTG